MAFHEPKVVTGQTGSQFGVCVLRVCSARLYIVLLLKPYTTFGTKHRLCLKKKKNRVHKKWIQKYLKHPTVVGNNNGYETFLFDDIREDMGWSKKTRKHIF